MPKTEINFPSRPFVSLTTLIVVSLILTGCGGMSQMGSSSGNPDKPSASSIKVTVTPATSDLRVSAIAQFTASVTNSTNKKVTWSVNGVPGGNTTVGKIDANGAYRAPVTVPSPNPVSIEASSAADTTVSASAAATIENPIPTMATVLPTSMPTGNFTISVTGTNFASGAVVMWGGKFLTTTFISSTSLRATGSETTAGTFKVTVMNPDPGSATSSIFSVQVAAPARPNVVSAAAAARFLEQATWGSSAGGISLVQQQGIAIHLNAELAYEASTYPPVAAGDGMDVVQAQFFLNARTKFDQLHQRVAFALSQIMVASANKVNNPSAFVLWQNMFQKDAFGNYLTLLTDVTLSPTMGNYLDMVNNDKPDPVAGTNPNENYGREVLQLFTIGLNQLNPDGTMQLDGSGNPIPTYSQDTVKGFARAFTGWTYPTKPGSAAHFGNPAYYSGPMIAFDDHHDTTAKELLNGVMLPAGGTARGDLTAALQNIFQHPNVGPFIGKQLIQHLVTSNPSPEYVARITAVFNNNGSGVRGDLRSVVRAILLDPEARRGDDPTQAQANDGRLKEPVQFMMNIILALNGTGRGDCLASYANLMKQPPMFSPSVFNFFHPDHVIEGTNLLGPEFEILDAGTTINRINFVNTYVYGTPCGTNRANLTSYVGLANNPTLLVDTIGATMLHGSMSTDMRSTLISTVSAISDPAKRAQAALYLVGTSSQFQVQH
jgi:uncharacterized protein (DUF1800 family)